MKTNSFNAETTAKERVLKNIRKALLVKSDNPYQGLEEASLYPAFSDSLEAVFAQQLMEAAGKFVFCEDEIDLVDNFLALVENQGLNKIYIWEPEIQAIFERYGVPFFRGDKDFEQAEIGVTSCESLIARNGSILISNANSSGRRLSIFPHVHVVIAYTSQLLPDIKDGLNLIKKKYGQQGLPSLISLITGPSRTADIEKTLILGAHGPRELYVFMLDDSILPQQG